ncbi:MAG TPA: dodecin family protein [Vicinamibacteria bacterium]|nr:dodecin family protein [Vicinamibacteria bacterium]
MANGKKDPANSVAKVSEISARSTKSFEDAIQAGIARAAKTLRNVRSAWVKEQRIEVSNGRITAYQVNLMITFTLDD